MTRIEAGATLEAPPEAVWGDIVAHERWPEWFGRGAADASEGEGAAPESRPAAGILRLDAVALLQGAPDRVGTERECAGTLGPLLPLLGGLGSRTLRWRDRIADVHAPWLLELDVQGARAKGFARARLRLIMVPGEAGCTRLRLRLSYAPGPFWWPLDVLLLRRAVAGGLREALAGLEARYRRAPAPAPQAFQEPAQESGPEADAGAVGAAA